MKKNLSKNRKFLIERVGYIRNRAKLSARELSQRLGFSIAYIAKFENGDFNIPTEVLLDLIEICGSTPEEFFSSNINNFKETNELIKEFDNMSKESKETLKNLIKNMK